MSDEDKRCDSSHLTSATGTGFHWYMQLEEFYRSTDPRPGGRDECPQLKRQRSLLSPSWRLLQVSQLSYTWELPKFMQIKANQLSLKSFILEGVSLFLLQMEECIKSKGTTGD